MTHRRLWTQQEDQLVLELVIKHGIKKWTEIGLEMKERSSSIPRSSKQIRERWHNYLDPQINREPWTLEEQSIIFEAHRCMGSKWKQIANRLKARTDNSVKNHFYSTLRRALRRMNKFVGSKNSTDQMRAVKPVILSRLIEEGESNPSVRELINVMFRFSHYKPIRSNQQGVEIFDISQRDNYHFVIQKLIECNHKYGRRNPESSKRDNAIQPMFQPLKISPQQAVKLERLELFNEEQEVMTTKGYDSQQVPIKEEQIKYNNQKWAESDINGMLPQLQHPQADDNLLSIACKLQQYFM